jgi:hypothetical protein
MHESFTAAISVRRIWLTEEVPARQPPRTSGTMRGAETSGDLGRNIIIYWRWRYMSPRCKLQFYERFDEGRHKYTVHNMVFMEIVAE